MPGNPRPINAGKGFTKGKSGNPGGQRKMTPELKALARGYTEEAIQTLAAVMRDSKAPPTSRVIASQTLLDRGWGRAPQHVTIEKTPLDDLTAETLAALAEALQRGEGEPVGGDKGTTRH